MTKPGIQLDIFEAKFTKGPGCWLWTARLDSDGYARYSGGRVAHRVSYELYVGPIPPGLTLDHLCRVRHCINPEHLEPVTSSENQHRGNGVAAINARKTHCKRGHEIAGGNVWISPKGHRYCRPCRHIRDAARSAA